VIAITCSGATERSALLSLCESNGWATLECHSVRATLRSLQRHQPRVVVTRHRLDDGYSDDIIAALATPEQRSGTKLIVLLDAGVPSAVEVRQINLGADCVLRNPIRTDVLIAYIGKCLKAVAFSRMPVAKASGAVTIDFCGGTFTPMDRTLCHGKHRISLTPREAVLIELLTQAPGSVASYERMYGEILGRRFEGDTSNMRVLLGKLAATCRSIGLSIRRHIQVIPKTGYRYVAPEGTSAGPSIPP
jgi:DNA-binding response OmpR family regulator